MIETCLEALDVAVTRTMNESLQRVFMRREVEEAMKLIDPLKSPGHDGFGA